MERYAAMPSFQCASQVTRHSAFDSPGLTPTILQNRSFEYEKPDRFLAMGTDRGRIERTVVCNGSQLLEYSNLPHEQATESEAPDKFWRADTKPLRDPFKCGTLLYQFFGGSNNFSGLVDRSKGPITFGPDESQNGELCRLVRFYGKQKYGNVEALIGERTGFVYRLRCDFDAAWRKLTKKQIAQVESTLRLALRMNKPGPERERIRAVLQQVSTTESLTGLMWLTETYSDIKSPAEIGPDDFDLTFWQQDPPYSQSQAEPKPPVPLGSSAPDFEVQALNGRKVKLSSFRGRPVMIDFWATWCPPCRKGLPETNHLSKLGAVQGLEVMAISNENMASIARFMKQNHYSVKTYQDDGSKAERAYKVEVIPVLAMIDAKGRLSSYMVGLRQPGEITAALAKMGLKGL